jgi:dedicator of cytokinesis protein 3
MQTGGEELVKFLQDVLDALFAIFSTEDGNSTPHSGLVFHALGKHTLFYLILAYTKF